MSPQNKVAIQTLPTGVPGLDDILGGGIPEFSFNIVAGSPGCGKTTFAHQLLFANATPERPALYFTILGEPAIKMLRYQQQYAFFDPAKVGPAIRFVNLGDLVMRQDLDAVLAAIVEEVTATNPGIIVVDSFRTVTQNSLEPSGRHDLQVFVQRLALYLTSWQVTSFLVGEYTDLELTNNPVFTVADGLIWLSQVAERDSIVRKLQVIKLRGQASVPGLHTFRITHEGLVAYSRTLRIAGSDREMPTSTRRLSTGIPGLDEMIGGGIPCGESLLVAGPGGTGKSLLATHFIAQGLKQGEPGIIAVFEERADYYVRRVDAFGFELEAARASGMLEVIYLRHLDLTVDEAMQKILDAVEKIGAKRVIIDSLTGFEMALAPGFRTDFRESLYRMIDTLIGIGVTIVSTVAIEDSFTSLAFSAYSISFLTDDLIRLRYVEIEGKLRKIMMVIKMRSGAHSKAIREYEITSDGLGLLPSDLSGYRGLTTGVPEPLGSSRPVNGVLEIPDKKV